MDSRTFLIALLFGAFAAGLAAVGLSVQDRYLAYRAEQTQVLSIEPETAVSAPSHFSLPELPELSVEERGTLIGVAVWGLGLLSYLWLLGNALKVGMGWAVAVFFGNYLAGLVFLLCHPDKAAKPMLLWTVILGYSLWHLFGPGH